MGIPCYHVMQQWIAKNQVLQLQDFHPYWFFNQSIMDMQIPLPILDPIVMHTKGWPRDSTNWQPKLSIT